MVQSIVDLLAPRTGGGLRASLEQSLRDAMRTGTLRPGTRLPSSRALATRLGVARGTVVDAYERLAAEGWLVTQPASSTTVAERPDGGPPAPNAASGGPEQPATSPAAPGRATLARVLGADATPPTAALDRTASRTLVPPHDLRPGRPEAGSFPHATWLAASRAALSRASRHVWDYDDPFGLPALRAALTSYLGATRGVVTHPDQVVVRAGFSDALAFTCDLLPTAAPVAAEATTMSRLRAVVARGGRPLLSLPVDRHGAVVSCLPGLRPAPAAVLLTPGHQFPLGATLTAQRRQALCRWARRSDAVVIEDDYDGEFRYDRRLVGALQGLDPEHVVYGGSATLTLAPALRLGWLALPRRLAAAARSPDTAGQPNPVPVIDQLTLCELLTSGEYDRHVRRMRRRYRQRRDTLCAMVAAEAPRLVVGGAQAGLHVTLLLPPDADEATVLAACAERGVGVGGLRSGAGLAPPAHTAAGGRPATGCPAGLVVGYATPPGDGFRAALSALLAALGDAGLLRGQGT